MHGSKGKSKRSKRRREALERVVKSRIANTLTLTPNEAIPLTLNVSRDIIIDEKKLNTRCSGSEVEV